MTDTIDQAQDFEQLRRDQALSDALAVNRAQVPGSETCEDCGVQIPEARRNAVPHATMCVYCQSEAD